MHYHKSLMEQEDKSY